MGRKWARHLGDHLSSGVSLTAGGITYLLNATYTSSKTAEDGTITYTETDGSIAASGGVADVTAQTTAAWGDLGWVSQDTNSAAGYGYYFTLNGSAIATTQLMAGWATNGIGTANMMNAVYVDGSGNVDTYVNGSAGVAGIGTVTNSQDEKFAIIKGGYNVNGVPMDAAANIASYAHGASIYQLISSTWTLLYKTSSILNTAQDYAAMSFYDYGGNYDDPRIPDADLSANLVPTVLDTFTDTNGTALASHTPDVDTVGSGWTEHSGAQLEIQSNKLSAGGGESATKQLASIDSGDTDMFVEAMVRATASTGRAGGLCLRTTDINNMWIAYSYKTNSSIHLYEVTATVWTERANATGITITAGTEYRQVFISDGDDLTFYFNDTNKLTYNSSVRNTLTNAGIYANGAEASARTWNNFAIWPRGTGSEYSDLDSY